MQGRGGRGGFGGNSKQQLGHVQRTNSAGSTGSAQGSKYEGDAKMGKAVDQIDYAGSKLANCFRCNEPGHLVKECKAELFSINCRKVNAHISERCGMLNMPFPVLKLDGCGANGLQLLVAQTGRKVEGFSNTVVTGLVQVLDGKINAEQLSKAFESQFPGGGKW